MSSTDAHPVRELPHRVQLWLRRDVEEPLERRLGGPERTRLIVLFACVLALDSADMSTVGAAAAPLERGLSIGNTQIGLLVTVSTAVGALVTLPFGVLVDRVVRIRLLWIAILTWAAAMIVAGASVSFLMLLLCRIALGVVVAVAAPAIASLVGDLFEPGERGRVYGYVLFGELLGAGIGYLVAGTIAQPLGWRYSFWVLAPPAAALAWFVSRVPEPERGGWSRLPAGATRIPRPHDADGPDDAGASTDQTTTTAAAETTGQSEPGADGDTDRGKVAEVVEHEGIEPYADLVLDTDPSRRNVWWAVRYVLSVRTNLYLIAASALGYFYFTGLKAFAVLYLRERFGLPQSTASMLLVLIGIGSVVGVLASGFVSDRAIARNHISARVVVGGCAFLIAAGLFVPGMLFGVLAAAVPFLFFAAAGLGGANPPLDAARLDIMHPRLWGRAESVRTVLRRAFEAAAPLTFGVVSGLFGGHSSGLGHPQGPISAGTGLEYTFLVMLVPLIAGGLLLLRGRRTYARDLATALASVDAVDEAAGDRETRPVSSR